MQNTCYSIKPLKPIWYIKYERRKKLFREKCRMRNCCAYVHTPLQLIFLVNLGQPTAQCPLNFQPPVILSSASSQDRSKLFVPKTKVLLTERNRRTGNSMSLGQQRHWHGQQGPSTINTVSSCALFTAYFGFHPLHLRTSEDKQKNYTYPT